MKKILRQTETAASTCQEGPQWYLATTLSERVAHLQQEATASSTQALPLASGDPAQAARRLKKWRSLPAFQHSAQAFAQRLAVDGLTEERLVALLGQTPEEVYAASPTPPAWLEELLTAFGEPDPATLACLPLEQIGDEATNAAFLALKPLLARGCARLQAGIASLQQRYTRLPFDPRVVSFQLLPHFLEKILNKPAKTLILELNVARVQGRLQGSTPQERYLYFLQQLTLPGHMLTLLEEYPVLARQLIEMTEHWVARSLELLQRLCLDWDQIRETFFPAGEPGTLQEISEGAGDAHHGERSVTILTWDSGQRLVYKPRSLAIDAHFQELLGWLNAHGCQPAFRTFLLLNKETYGWYEFVAVNGCASQQEVERFYQRMGGYVALLYTLEGTDFHAENLLAAGEYPMLVDLESLFQPHTQEFAGVDRYGYELITHSVRRSGLLPGHQWLNDAAPGTDLSGLGAGVNQQPALATNAWSGTGTDEMQISQEQVQIKLGNHRPTLQGAEVDTLDYEAEIIAGFTTVYRILLQQREQLLQSILPRFACDEVRVLLRQTQQYARLISDSAHPDVLRDALDRAWLFDRLWLGVEQEPHLARVIAAEYADLQGGDIPRFTTIPGSRDLRAARHICMTDFFPLSGLELVREGIQRMSEGDLERQSWIIRASLACMEMNRKDVKPGRNLDLQPAQAVATPAQLIAQARAIGERVLELAVNDEETIGWLVVNLLAGVEWSPVPAGPDLYNGLPGITLFLAYLGEISQEKHYTNMARKAVQTIQKMFVPRAQVWHWNTVGAFDGIGSLLYLCAHLGSLWQDDTLYQEAREIVQLLPELLGEQKPFDMLSGCAGTIGALLSFYAAAPDEETLRVAVRYGDYLLEHARTMARGIAWSTQDDALPLAGLSHGNAGIALNLLRLAQASGETRFHEVALAAMEYERSVFSQEKKNWPDLRGCPADLADNEQAKCKYMTSWCHGAPGIGLARMASLQYHDDPAIRTEIEDALQTTLKEGFGRNHSLCHGDMGSLAVLLMANHLLPEQYAKELASLQAVLLNNLQAQGCHSGIPYPIETPGLMLGMSGTGYALLRLAAPDRVPELLVLAPPLPRD
ncbi:MAG TPA: type 2 lanthipeptide synthetase LanM family protein [Ktedonobacteraceae bacterium]